MRIAIALSLFLSPLVYAADIETDLNGVRLQQFTGVISPVYGKPFQTMRQGHTVAEAFSLNADSYMVVAHDEQHPDNISMLQITGSKAEIPAFLGLHLGDEKQKVIATLGNPDHISEVDDPKVSRLAFKGRNYTVELDARGNLYSIQIFTTADLMKSPDSPESAWAEFKEAILSKDLAQIFSVLRPDAEIYRAGQTLSINRPISVFREKPDPAFVAALIGKTQSVLLALAESEPEVEMRLSENYGLGYVYKFKNGSIVSEIYFLPYNGKYRAFEVSFKETSK